MQYPIDIIYKGVKRCMNETYPIMKALYLMVSENVLSNRTRLTEKKIILN